MAFHFAFWKKQKMGKLIGDYVSDRVKEKRAFQEQLKRLYAQLQDKTIDQQIYDRLRDILEVKFILQREEARISIQHNLEESSGVETHKMFILKELSEKIEMLEDEKTQFLEDVKALRKEAEEKASWLECEVAVLQEEAESLRKMLKTF
jgi:uncharacterized protein (UPF0335 family)